MSVNDRRADKDVGLDFTDGLSMRGKMLVLRGAAAVSSVIAIRFYIHLSARCVCIFPYPLSIPAT